MARKVALLLEDEAMIAIEVESSLKDEGFDVVTFDTCGAALDWLAAMTRRLQSSTWSSGTERATPP